MLNQFTLKLFTIVLAVVLAVVLVLTLWKKPSPPTAQALPVAPAMEAPQDPTPPQLPPAEPEKAPPPDIKESHSDPGAEQPATVSAPAKAAIPESPSSRERKPESNSSMNSAPAVTHADQPPAAKPVANFAVYSRGNRLTNGVSFSEMDEKFGLNSPGDITWEFRAPQSQLRGSAALKWLLNGKPRGYPMPLTETMLNARQTYPDMPEPGVWEIRLARPGERDQLLFTFTILKEDKGANP